MGAKYAALLEPLEVAGGYLKNRMIASPYNFHFIQGPEDWPSQALINHFINKAKAGAALVTCKGKAASPPNMPPDAKAHILSLDYTSGASMHYFAQMTEGIHAFGAKATMLLIPDIPHEYDASSGIASLAVAGDGSISKAGVETPREMIPEFVNAYVKDALAAKQLGFDGVFIHAAYQSKLPARFLSPITNKRTDEYGGGIENRAKFLLMICEAIKKACGKSFIIESSITGEEPGGTTLEDTVRLAHMAEGLIDLMQLRHWDIDYSHPINFELNRNPLLYMAETVKKSNPKLAVVAIGGFSDLALSDGVIKEGRADVIAMARAWICNPDYGNLAYEGRGEDVAPCLRCNKCHRSSDADPWADYCSVNPIWGMEDRLGVLTSPPERKKKVAVIGGGIAGMEAALRLSKRGHDVTLFEKEKELGGAVLSYRDIDFKFPIKDFCEYLTRQVGKSGAKVLLGMEADPEKIKGGDFDEVIAAIGADINTPPIPGTELSCVSNAKYVFENEPKLGEKVVIIGGGEIGTECGIFLARKGHEVTVLEMKDKLAADAAPVHFYRMFKDAWEREEKFHYIVNATCKEITESGVVYEKEGKEEKLPADSVLIAAGLKAKTEQAMKFFKPGDKVHLAGDCVKAGNIQKAMRSAYFTAENI